MLSLAYFDGYNLFCGFNYVSFGFDVVRGFLGALLALALFFGSFDSVRVTIGSSLGVIIGAALTLTLSRNKWNAK